MLEFIDGGVHRSGRGAAPLNPHALVAHGGQARLTTDHHEDAALDLASKPSRLLAENAALVRATLAGVHGIENL